MKFVAILTSLPVESDNILAILKNIKKSRIAGKTVYKGKLSGRNVVLMNSGLGKVNASHSATCVIEHFSIGYVLNAGAGGAYPLSGIGIGDIAIASAEIYGDEGVITLKGGKRPAYKWSGLEDIGIPLVQNGKKRIFNEICLNKKILRKAVNSLKKQTAQPGGVKIKAGRFVTVSAASGSKQRASELEGRFNAICENMEGAAVAHVCALYKIPLLEIRGISNIAGVRDKRSWNLRLASYNCQEAVLRAIKDINWP